MRQARRPGFTLLFASIAFALITVACSGSSDTTGSAGTAGGVAGTTGAAGTVGSTGAGGGAAGTTGAAGGGGATATTGAAGSTGGAAGTVGTTGAAALSARPARPAPTGGRGGTTGAGGAAGTAGTGGRGGTTGAGGTAGTAGAAGRGGTSGGGGAAGTTGAAGRGGTTGAGGAAGTTGAAGRGGTTGAAGRGGTTGTGGTAGTTNVDAGWDAPPLPAMVSIHVAGDSTAAIFPATDPTMRVGWAAVLDPLFDSSVTVDDAALSGRSTKSYIDEGAWTTLQAKIKSGDYLFVEFAHNDEKTDDPTRYTDPATTYRDNLRTFINGARARGGFPVLLTSICRRQFSGSTVTGTHGAYTTAMFAVGQETGTPVIDMEKRTKDWLTALGPTNSIPMFAMDDNTHLSMQGAVEVAKLAVAGIRDAGLPIAARALP